MYLKNCGYSEGSEGEIESTDGSEDDLEQGVDEEGRRVGDVGDHASVHQRYALNTKDYADENWSDPALNQSSCKIIEVDPILTSLYFFLFFFHETVYHDSNCDVADLSNVVVDEDDDVDLDKGNGVLEDPDHEREEIAGEEAGETDDEDDWAPFELLQALVV